MKQARQPVLLAVERKSTGTLTKRPAADFQGSLNRANLFRISRLFDLGDSSPMSAAMSAANDKAGFINLLEAGLPLRGRPVYNGSDLIGKFEEALSAKAGSVVILPVEVGNVLLERAIEAMDALEKKIVRRDAELQIACLLQEFPAYKLKNVNRGNGQIRRTEDASHIVIEDTPVSIAIAANTGSYADNMNQLRGALKNNQDGADLWVRSLLTDKGYISQRKKSAMHEEALSEFSSLADIFNGQLSFRTSPYDPSYQRVLPLDKLLHFDEANGRKIASLLAAHNLPALQFDDVKKQTEMVLAIIHLKSMLEGGQTRLYQPYLKTLLDLWDMPSLVREDFYQMLATAAIDKAAHFRLCQALAVLNESEEHQELAAFIRAALCQSPFSTEEMREEAALPRHIIRSEAQAMMAQHEDPGLVVLRAIILSLPQAPEVEQDFVDYASRVIAARNEAEAIATLEECVTFLGVNSQGRALLCQIWDNTPEALRYQYVASLGRERLPSLIYSPYVDEDIDMDPDGGWLKRLDAAVVKHYFATLPLWLEDYAAVAYHDGLDSDPVLSDVIFKFSRYGVDIEAVNDHFRAALMIHQNSHHPFSGAGDDGWQFLV